MTCPHRGGTGDLCWRCQRQSEVAERRRLPIPVYQNTQFRTPDEDRRIVALIVFLRQLDEWNVARYCELVLRAHLGPTVEVRGQRPERRVAPPGRLRRRDRRRAA